MTAAGWVAMQVAGAVTCIALLLSGVYGVWFVQQAVGANPTTPRTQPIYVQYVPPSNVQQAPGVSTPTTVPSSTVYVVLFVAPPSNSPTT